MLPSLWGLFKITIQSPSSPNSSNLDSPQTCFTCFYFHSIVQSPCKLSYNLLIYYAYCPSLPTRMQAPSEAGMLQYALFMGISQAPITVMGTEMTLNKCLFNEWMREWMNLEIQLTGSDSLKFCAKKDSEVLLRSSREMGMSATISHVSASDSGLSLLCSNQYPQATTEHVKCC